MKSGTHKRKEKAQQQIQSSVAKSREPLNISRKNVWYLDQNNLHASVHRWAFPSDIFNHLLNSELDVKMSSFLPTAGLLFDDK